MGDIEKFHDLIEGFDTAMLITRGDAGVPHARPMAVAKLDPDDTLWFVTSIDSAKVDELEDDPAVCVAFQKPRAYVSLTGTAHVVEDRDRIRALWSKGFDLWFPDGPDDPQVVALMVEPQGGEYWDDRGANGVKFALRAVKAFVSGERIEHDPSEHGKLGH